MALPGGAPRPFRPNLRRPASSHVPRGLRPRRASALSGRHRRQPRRIPRAGHRRPRTGGTRAGSPAATWRRAAPGWASRARAAGRSSPTSAIRPGTTRARRRAARWSRRCSPIPAPPPPRSPSSPRPADATTASTSSAATARGPRGERIAAPERATSRPGCTACRTTCSTRRGRRSCAPGPRSPPGAPPASTARAAWSRCSPRCPTAPSRPTPTCRTPASRSTRERLLSAPFIVSADYGTRCSTVVTLGRDGEARFVERSFDPAGRGTGTVDVRFRLAAAP